MSAKKNYDVYDTEFLIIIEIFKEWRHYFEEIQHMIEIVCDHQNLKYFIITKTLNRKQNV
jgi:hypothetical protein